MGKMINLYSFDYEFEFDTTSHCHGMFGFCGYANSEPLLSSTVFAKNEFQAERLAAEKTYKRYKPKNPDITGVEVWNVKFITTVKVQGDVLEALKNNNYCLIKKLT